MDLVAAEPNALSCDMEKTHFYHTKIREFVVPHLRAINLLKETTPTLILHNEFFFQSHWQGSGENQSNQIEEKTLILTIL
jgi:hypothetical protein